jgi:hypothetical protein
MHGLHERPTDDDEDDEEDEEKKREEHEEDEDEEDDGYDDDDDEEEPWQAADRWMMRDSILPTSQLRGTGRARAWRGGR